MGLPIIRSHERMDFKRCPKKWFWAWRKGLTPRAKSFGALELGIWMHEALAKWYTPGSARNGVLASHFNMEANKSIQAAKDAGAPDHVIEKAEELAALGWNMARSYEEHYSADHDVIVIKPELPLAFTFNDDAGEVIARHDLKPDLVYTSHSTGDVWLMEHKTATTVRTEHLVIDDQARPYGAMAELGLRKLGLIRPGQHFMGIMYNYLRKATTDDRPRNALGQALNLDGTVSKRQPPPTFLRHPVKLTRAAKRITLTRLRGEVMLITGYTNSLRNGTVPPDNLPKTQHTSCPRFCQFFPICAAQENGADIRDMTASLYVVRNPYDYSESTDEPASFELG